jgi:hypothetical protein
MSLGLSRFQVTLNQRVQDSSPCAPTSDFRPIEKRFETFVSSFALFELPDCGFCKHRPLEPINGGAQRPRMVVTLIGAPGWSVRPAATPAGL